MLTLSLCAARALMLAAQGLLTPPVPAATKADVLASIRRMGALQIDTINVVARSPYLVLWSRLGPYEPRWLDELLAEGALFEYWSHAACFLPIDDYALYRPAMREGWKQARAWLEAHPVEVARVLDRQREQGAVRSADFARTGGPGAGWWDWKPEKRALECLYATGELMIAGRDRNFQRLYDRRERVLPAWDDARMPPAAEARRALTLQAVRAMGVARPGWVPDYFRLPGRGMAALLDKLAADGSLLRVAVEGWNGPAYVHPDHAAPAAAAAAGRLRPEVTTLLSPFDPLVWHRPRALELFGFGYRIETYTPAAQRRYGYFSLPILHNGALVGRLDAKAHRLAGAFEVRALHLEPEVTATEELVGDLAAALRACAAWHGTPEIIVRLADPPEVAVALALRLAA